MRLIQQTVPSNCDIVLHGDNHEGNPTTYRSGLKKLINWIGAKPNRFFVQMGDALESRTVDHKYYQHDPDALPVPLRQRDAVVELYEPIADRGLCWLRGNHEDSLYRIGDITEDICKQLKIPNGGMTAKLRLVTSKGNQICKIYAAHPSRLTLRSTAKDEVQKVANMQASLKRQLCKMAADCLIMVVGHTHKLLVLEPSQELIMTSNNYTMKQQYLSAGDGASEYIEPNRRWYGATGSFLRSQVVGKDSYAEKYNYDPIELGYLIVRIRKSKVAEVVRKVV